MPQAPLFFYGLSLLIGIASKLHFHLIYLPIFALILFFFRKHIVSSLLVSLAGYLFATYAVTLPTLPEEGIEGRGLFIPDSISYGHSPFGTSIITKGTLQTFSSYSRIPCQIYTPLHKPRLPVDQSLLIEGRLLPKTYPHYVLKPKEVHPIPSTFSLAEFRFQIKNWTRQTFASIFPHKETAAFLLSMITGEIDDRLMALQFNRIGLLHLLGVSGFQFSLLALLLGSLIRLALPGKKGIYLLILFLSLYAFILGNSPPIQRAYLSVVLFAIARMYNLQISALNALGAALIWELLLDPCVFFQLGFQFSFLCTAAIFLVYPPIRDFFKQWLPARSFSEIRQLSLFDRVGHTLTFFCCEAFTLNLAIHLVSLPLIFIHFHKFPLLSLAYNLFLPPLVSIAYVFLIPGLFLYPISHIVALPFLRAAGSLTEFTLLIANHPPAYLDFQLRLPSFTLGFALTSLTLLLALFYQRRCRLDRALG